MMTPQSALARFYDLWGTLSDLRHAAEVLEWDQLVFMPPGGASARAEQLATLRRLAHEQLTSPAMGEAIAAAEAAVTATEADRAALRVARREYERAVRLPAALVVEQARAASAGYHAWLAARQAGDFRLFAPCLQRLVALARQRADALGHDGEPYDALLADHEPELSTAVVHALFEEVAAALLPLRQHLLEQPAPPPLGRPGPEGEQAQLELGRLAVTAFGFRWQDGRQDRSVHPFSTAFSPHDTRITTRLSTEDFAEGFFATLHESGHALYEQGIDEAWSRKPLEEASSTGVHESQSRLWENQVGRSQPFWEFLLPAARRVLPAVFGDRNAWEVYRAVNRLSPTLVRVEADEVSYHFHIVLRLRLELALLHGDLPVDDLPGAWDEASVQLLGRRPADLLEGVLQDVHWSGGDFGYFPSYALGNILAAIWMAAARQALPDLDRLIAAGSFSPLLDFLRRNIHRWGAWYTPAELVRRVTGEDLQAAPYLAALREKYGALYGV